MFEDDDEENDMGQPIKCDADGCSNVFYLGQGAAGADFSFCKDHSEQGVSRV